MRVGPAILISACLVTAVFAQEGTRKRVGSFVRTALGGVLPPSYSSSPSKPLLADLGEPRVESFLIDDVVPTRKYAFRKGSVVIDTKRSLIRRASFGIDRDHWRESFRTLGFEGPVSETQVATLAQLFYSAAGFPQAVTITRTEQRHNGDGNEWVVGFSPLAGDVPYAMELGGQLILDAATGVLLSFHALALDPPKAPLRLAPNVRVDQARLAVAHSVLQIWDVVLCEDPACPAALCIAASPRASAPAAVQWRDPDGLELDSEQGRLVFAVTFIDPTTHFCGQHGAEYRYGGVVDALTGRVLNRTGLRNEWAVESAPPILKPRVWPEGARMWRFAPKDGDWSREVSSAVLPEPTSSFQPGPYVALTDGNTFFRASVDPATGNLGLAQPDGSWLVGRPSPALRSAILRTLGRSKARHLWCAELCVLGAFPAVRLG